MALPHRGTQAKEHRSRSAWQLLSRGAAALSLAGMMTLTVIAGGREAVAQTASVGTAAATISPADSILYVGFSLDTESDQWKLTEELLQRAGVEETGSEILGDVSSGATGQAIGNDQAFLGGEAAFVVTSLDAFSDQASSLSDMVGMSDLTGMVSMEATAAGWVFILQPSDIESAAQQIDTELMAQDSTVQIMETEYNGATIRSAPANETTGDSAFAYSIVNGFIIVSETPSDLEPFIDASAGTVDTLSDVESFNQADEALAGDRLGFGYLDTTTIGEDLASVDTSGLDLGTSFDELLGSSFYTGMSLIADPVGFRFETVEIPAGGASTGAMGATPEAGSSVGNPSFAERVPGDSLVLANGFNLGQGPLLQGLGLALVTGVSQATSSSFDESTPVPMPSVDELYDQAAQLLGFNLKTDFIDQMVGEYGFALWGADASDPSQIGAILTSGVESPATLADTLSKLSFLIQAGAQGEANVTTRAVGDYNINTITVTQEGGEPIVIEYGIIDGQFVLGYGDGVDTYIAGTDTSLADNEDYQTALGALPSNYDGVLYVNVPAAMALSESSSMSDQSAFVDSPELCGQYQTQDEAQVAYDADPVANFEMDWDFDGIACEDFFVAATPDASPVAEATDTPIRSFAGVSYEEDGLGRTSSILVIDQQ